MHPRILDIDIIVNMKIALAYAHSIEPTCVLSERTLPGNRHGEHKGVEARMIKAFPDKFPRGENDPW